MSEVAVIGGGIAGIQAALDIANHGIRVHLIEREPSIGGHMAMLDKTFPTNDCSLCILSPKMNEVSQHPLITIHTCTEVTSVEGEPGAYRLGLVAKPRYIDVEKCNGCGDCIVICPVEVYNRFDAGIGVRKAIYKPHAQAVPDLVIRDAAHCIECGLCYDICGLDAIRKEEEERKSGIEVASIILATGYSVFDARGKGALGYLTVPDVITSLELERLINASGPTGGKVARVSTGAVPESVVFVQCVGSRDVSIGRPWCSCVCCMAAIKNAILLKEKHPGMEVTICHNDIRTYGKGYEEYLNRAEGLGIRFLKGLPGEVWDDGRGPSLQVENTETQAVEILQPGLVVLSVGIGPCEGNGGLAGILGLSLEESGFVKPLDDKLGPFLTERCGIYLAGTATAPRDIPDSVAMGEAAAMRAFTDTLRE
ncbi:MAG TPA: CoB--CoM heterodisulfide reductase iron-sulfur subunit A family protein [Methanomicrobiales archaeon]|jgi:heterodisulfide reductase subunit A|nr:CoB--CoM heterodisulfide reductase iron-sulfur subunit A family protein [Methanomicrobiales archaeon]